MSDQRENKKPQPQMVRFEEEHQSQLSLSETSKVLAEVSEEQLQQIMGGVWNPSSGINVENMIERTEARMDESIAAKARHHAFAEAASAKGDRQELKTHVALISYHGRQAKQQQKTLDLVMNDNRSVR